MSAFRFVLRDDRVELPGDLRAELARLDAARTDDAVSATEWQRDALALIARVARFGEAERRAFVTAWADLLAAEVGLPARCVGWIVP